MFVSVLRGETGHREIIECDRVQILNSSDDGYDMMSLQLWTGREQPRDVWVEVNKKDGSEVYLMNNDGKTIDTYRWAWMEDPKKAIKTVNDGLSKL